MFPGKIGACGTSVARRLHLAISTEESIEGRVDEYVYADTRAFFTIHHGMDVCACVRARAFALWRHLPLIAASVFFVSSSDSGKTRRMVKCLTDRVELRSASQSSFLVLACSAQCT